jgi:hypothetical protein
MTSRFFWVAPVGLVALLAVGVWKAREGKGWAPPRPARGQAPGP